MYDDMDVELLSYFSSEGSPPATLQNLFECTSCNPSLFSVGAKLEWADNNIDAYSIAVIKVGPCSLPGSRVGGFDSPVILPLAHTIEHEEFLEVIKLEGIAHSSEDEIMPRDIFLLQIVRHAESWNVFALEAIG
ncbi:hypothetical protein CRYUN_Cryun01aG0083200 [Craigia yunnanensis]